MNYEDDNKKIIVDFKTIKALSVDARLNILKSLCEKPKTLSDLAGELSLAPSTVKEHLNALLSSELIEKEKTDRKWKYYYLTKKGRKIIERKEINTTFVFVSSIVLVVFGIYGLFEKINQKAVEKTARVFSLESANTMLKMATTTGEEIVKIPFYQTELFLSILSYVILPIGLVLMITAITLTYKKEKTKKANTNQKKKDN